MGKRKAFALRSGVGNCLFAMLAALLLWASVSAGSASAQENAPTACTPVIGRVVSVQGVVEVLRAGSSAWLRVARLDTPVCSGDQLRTDRTSRSALFLRPETLVRVDRNTTIALSETTAVISVEFSRHAVAQAC